MNILQNIWTWIIGSLATALVMFRSIMLKRVRLRDEHVSVLLELLRTEGKKWVIYEELTDDPIPRIFTALCWIKWTPFYLSIDERMLRAGYSGTDTVIGLTALRFRYRHLFKAITKPRLETSVPVSVLGIWGPSKIGQLDIPEEAPSLYCGQEVAALLDKDIKAIKKGERHKTGALLYGPPGNGKSYLARYLALKHRLPIYILALTPEHDNQALIRMFSRLKGPAILIMEDFDGYFDNRVPLNKEAKFTFDAFLNVLDGTYASMEGIIVFMTANDINKIDVALKYRPSRLRYVRELEKPSREVCKEIIGESADVFEGYSLDILLFVKDLLGQGLIPNEAKREIYNLERNIRLAEDEHQKRKEKENEKAKAETKKAS